MAAKYVMTEKGCIIFPNSFSYDEFARYQVTSAGTVSIQADDNGKLVADCYGESVSLGLHSDVNDSMLVTRQILCDY